MARTLAQGQTFAGYLIERLLGVGGMGEVYLARDRDLPRLVALKLLSPAVADDSEVRARFLREADTAARLAHPNIVAVYARGRTDDRLWMAMQYIEGTDVAAVLRDGPLRPDHAVRILGETARALDHAHQAGVLHRDVKPANILLAWGPEQRVFLADFGIAKALDQTSALTRTGQMYASFQYASPEQFELRTDMDQRSDVYALGCTLYHMLTGELPYPGGSTAQLVNGHLNGRIPQPSERNPAVSPEFDAVIARALAKDREHRYGSCGEFATAAAQALTGTDPGAAPWTPPEQGTRPQVYPAGFSGTTQTSAPTQLRDATPDHVPAPTHRPRRRGRKRLIAAAVVAAIIVGGAGAGFGSGALKFTIGAGSPPLASTPGGVPTDASRDGAVKAACDYGILMTTYDYGDGDGWQAKVVNGATGTWKTQAQQLLPAIRLLLDADSEHTRGTDAKCTITSGNTTHYELAVDVTQVNSTKGRADTTDHQNVTMSMDYVDGQWLCSKWVSPLFPA
ncbi:serine/threonine protein kinase [Nocardia sp. NBC_01503]|uniref:serine/threonine-protein kinase n=1 Tax=Nocardia sp. NBC_01503 TaxID=2975997 RepID=UPI002E7B5AFA|nr:serine/threonine-protein kinase [Nocardia sp. NBC_01503]WTL31849.1 serine/threonine protein kinase [Nocardia sp. NBC_01503]